MTNVAWISTYLKVIEIVVIERKESAKFTYNPKFMLQMALLTNTVASEMAKQSLTDLIIKKMT